MKILRNRFTGIKLNLLIVALFLVTGCAPSSDGDGGGGGSSEGSIDMTSAASQALPAVSSSSSPSSASAESSLNDGITANFSTPTAAITDEKIKQFFKLECHMDGGDDNCPTGVTADADTKYTVTSLIGVIYHAEMYMENVLNNDVSECSTTSVDASSFVTDDLSGDTSTYLIDYYDQLNCIGTSTYDSQTQYYATQTDTSSKYVMMVARKHDMGTAGWDQSDIYQAYLSKDSSENNRILAFNTTNINDTDSTDSTFRTLLLVNLSTRKFLVKHRSGTDSLVAAGQGGISETGTFLSGYYFAKIPSNSTGICVNNETQEGVAPANCTAEDATWDGPSDVATYLDMTAAEQTDLTNFVSYFTTGPTKTELAAYPTTAADAMHIPDRIE